MKQLSDLNACSSCYPATQSDWIDENLPGTRRAEVTLTTTYIVFNAEKPPFDNPKVRNALSLALQREIITDKILKAGQVPAWSPGRHFAGALPAVSVRRCAAHPRQKSPGWPTPEAIETGRSGWSRSLSPVPPPSWVHLSNDPQSQTWPPRRSPAKSSTR